MLEYFKMSAFFLPVITLLVSFLSFHWTIHASNEYFRAFFFALYLHFAILSFVESKLFASVPFFMCLWAQSVIANITHITSILLTETWPTPLKDQNNPSFFASLRATYKLWANLRAIPEATVPTAKNEEEYESTLAVLVMWLRKLSKYSLFHTYAIPYLFTQTIGELYLEDVNQTALLSRLPDVTIREIVVRSWVAVYWIWESILIIDSTNTALAFLAVFTGLDQPADWPPLFGEPITACGLQNFWARFWHQLSSRPHKRFAKSVIRGIRSMGINMPPVVSRTLLALIVFSLSGLSHMAVSWNLGYHHTLDLEWFLLNFAGCMVERATLFTARHLAKRVGYAQELEAFERSLLGRMVGFVWVFVFFFWSVPPWKFPGLQSDLPSKS